MSYWKTGYRKVNGHKRKVRKLFSKGAMVRPSLSKKKIGTYHRL